MSENLMEGLLSEMNRVRNMIKEYEHPMLEGAGTFAALMLKADIQQAEKSIATNDVIEMIKCYKTLKEYEL